MNYKPFNSTAGYSIGITQSTVIDSSGNIVCAGISAAGGTFGALTRFTAGISAAGGITFNSDVSVNSANTLNVSTIKAVASGKSQLDIDNRASARVAIGDFDVAGNATSIFLRDGAAELQLINPYGSIQIGDPNGIDTGAYIYYEPAEGTLHGNGSSIANFANASFDTLFSGTISLNGQIFTNVVSSVNGLTANVSVLMAPIGITSGNYTVFTYPDGVTTTGSKRPYYQSPYYGGRDAATRAMSANRTYFILHNAPRGVSLTSLRLSTAATGITGNVYFSVWSVNLSNGLPNQRLYVSSSTTVPSGYGFATVTNASGLVAIPAGSFYIAASFSSAPTLYTHTGTKNIHVFGGTDYTSGYNNYLPVMHTNGFTAPSSITQSGATFGFIDYYPGNIPIPILEWQGA